MERSELMAQLVFWLYRVDSYLLANFIEDPAWLAFMFC
jgi:hypothetical protein